jgi:hypothetical protein
MSISIRNILVTAIGAVLLALGPAALSGGGGGTSASSSAAKVSAIEGSTLKKLVLTQKAAARLDIRTGQVADEEGRLSTPYSSVVYDPAGVPWVYTNPEPLTFVRHGIVVDSIQGSKVYLKKGPASGTTVVTVGVAELYGTEKGLGGH